MQTLLDAGISTRRGIMASHTEAPYRDPQWPPRLLHTEQATAETLILPLFHQMTDDEQGYVLEAIRNAGQVGAVGPESIAALSKVAS